MTGDYWTSMDSRRVRIYAVISLLLLGIVVLRLASLQLSDRAFIQDRIARLKELRGRSLTLGTVRGWILDRTGKILAYDQANFKLNVSYRLTQYMDDQVLLAKRMAAANSANPQMALAELERKTQQAKATLEHIIVQCSRFGDPCEVLWQRIYDYNRSIWLQRLFQAWRRNCTESALYKRNAHRIESVNLADALEDLRARIPDPNERIRLAGQIDIAEMHGSTTLTELLTDDDVLAAELEFLRIEEVRIDPEPERVYPYGAAAAQVIGWVGSATQPQDLALFAGDPQRSYQDGDVCGREDGVEYVCEVLLRGKRGKVVYDVEGTLARRTANRLGQDIRLAIDIQLQASLEEAFTKYPLPGHCGPGIAALVLQVQDGQVLAMVSLPTYDLNKARYRYQELASDPNMPLVNRVLNRQYPAGSVVKPIVLAAALQMGVISPDHVIACPSQRTPDGWPNCWIFRQQGQGHDVLWTNNARNAIKGSCNIYFSRLADMLDPAGLQAWMWAFGLGHQLDLGSPPCRDPNDTEIMERHPRPLRQAAGQISSRPTYGMEITSIDQLPALARRDLRLVGIGQGNCWVTPLQVGAEMATIARGGIFMQPRLFADDTSAQVQVDLHLTPECLKTLYDGLYAVVNEKGGTAFEAFGNNPFGDHQVRVYGKTGSTEDPANAWFAGFATDQAGRSIALAVVVEGGTSGPSDAAPLGRLIIAHCIQAGYLGN